MTTQSIKQAAGFVSFVPPVAIPCFLFAEASAKEDASQICVNPRRRLAGDGGANLRLITLPCLSLVLLSGTTADASQLTFGTAMQSISNFRFVPRHLQIVVRAGYGAVKYSR